MNAINRQKFLAELARLLTFMYEEDRQYALGMYERMFNIAAEDEQWLIQKLMSPTRQAVIIARSYNNKARKLTVATQSKAEDGYEEEEDETPPFVLAINKIFDDLFPDDTATNEPVDDQVSFFELGMIEEAKPKKKAMPKAAVLLDNTQNFPAVVERATAEEMKEEPATEQEEDREKILVEEAEEKQELVDEADPVKEIAQDQEDDAPAEAVSTDKEQAEQPVAEEADREAQSQEMQNSETAETNEPEHQKSVSEQLEETPQTPFKKRRRRSIEELLGFRKDKKTAEDNPDHADEKETPADVEQQPAAAEKHTEEPVELSAQPEKVATETAAQAPIEDDGEAAASEPERKSIPEMAVVSEPEKISVPENAAASESEQRTALENTGTPAPEQINVPENAATPEPEHTSSPEPIEIPGSSEQETIPAIKTQTNETPEEDAPVIRKPKRKKVREVPMKTVPRIPLLILFLIVAIPVTLALLVLLVIPVALSLSLSFGLIALGVVLVLSAFSGFAVLADIMLLIGMAIVALAVGLLLLWVALWLVGSVMVGLVRWVRELSEQWCYKEVPAE